MARRSSAVNAHSWNITYWHDLKRAWNSAQQGRVGISTEGDREFLRRRTDETYIADVRGSLRARRGYDGWAVAGHRDRQRRRRQYPERHAVRPVRRSGYAEHQAEGRAGAPPGREAEVDAAAAAVTERPERNDEAGAGPQPADRQPRQQE